MYAVNYPGREFEDSTGVTPRQSVFLQVAAGGTNVLMISGAAGRKIRIVGGTLASQSAAGVTIIKSGTGTNKRVLQVPVNTAATPNVWLVNGDWDCIELDTGDGLYVTNASASDLFISVTYISYTP